MNDILSSAFLNFMVKKMNFFLSFISEIYIIFNLMKILTIHFKKNIIINKIDKEMNDKFKDNGYVDI